MSSTLYFTLEGAEQQRPETQIQGQEQFPNEASLERFVCCYYSELNRSYADRMQRGFQQASVEILRLFENQEINEI